MRLTLRRLARSPLAYWAAVVALACFTGATVAGQLGRAEAQAARYGRLRPAVVATQAIEAGSVLRATDVTVRSVPAAFLPEGALRSADAVVGRTVVVPLFGGAAVVDANLAPEGLGGLAALLPPGTRAVAVPAGTESVAVRRGDRVDVLATLDPPPAGQDPTFAVAEAALVVDVGPEAVSVAVDAADAPRVAYAVAAGVVALALSAEVTPARPAPPSRPAPGTPRTAGTTGSAPPAAPATPPQSR